MKNLKFHRFAVYNILANGKADYNDGWMTDILSTSLDKARKEIKELYPLCLTLWYGTFDLEEENDND